MPGRLHTDVTKQKIRRLALQYFTKRDGAFKNFEVECHKCLCKFNIKERENLFPKKEKYFCSRSCANTKIHSEQTKIKIAKSGENPPSKRKCNNCGKQFIVQGPYKRRKKNCSKECGYASMSKKLKLIDHYKRIGTKSAQSQKRRSKNEIYFSELCTEEFRNVLMNEPIFNGWDADVVLIDFKMAILWNGKWHYEKITKEHSLKQVQNRDRLKIIEIKKYGYEPYIVRDLGRFDEAFVEKEFKTILAYIHIR